MHLAIVEPHAAGHHLTLHVRAIAREALVRGWRLRLLTTAATTRHPAYEVLRRATGDALETSLLPDEVGRMDRRFLTGIVVEARRWRALRAAAGEILAPLGVDVVYDAGVERTARAMAMFGSPFARIPFVGLYTKVRFHHRRMGVRSQIGPRARLVETAAVPRLLALQTLRALPVLD